MNLVACASLPYRAEVSTWYRAILPEHQATALQTSQSLDVSSRFSAGPVGKRLGIPPFEILYLGESTVVTLWEVYAMVGNSYLPTTWVTPPGGEGWTAFAVGLTLQRCVDLTDPAVQSALATNDQELTGAWEHYRSRLAPTQELGQALFAAPGIEGFISRSAKVPAGKTLILFPQKLLQNSRVVSTIAGQEFVIDGLLPPP